MSCWKLLHEKSDSFLAPAANVDLQTLLMSKNTTGLVIYQARGGSALLRCDVIYHALFNQNQVRTSTKPLQLNMKTVTVY